MYINRMIREMVPVRYTKEEAARLVGVSLSTIKRWKGSKLFVPTETKEFGSIIVDLYTPEDIPVLQAIKRASKPGRKKKRNAEEGSSTTNKPR
jgi:hypothetical protein